MNRLVGTAISFSLMCFVFFGVHCGKIEINDIVSEDDAKIELTTESMDSTAIQGNFIR